MNSPLGRQNKSVDENAPPRRRIQAGDKFSGLSSNRSVLQESQVINVSRNSLNLVDVVNELNTQKKSDGIIEDDWKERNEIITKLDHEENVNCAVEILASLLDQLPIERAEDPINKSNSLDSLGSCAVGESSFLRCSEVAEVVNGFETDTETTISKYESARDELFKSDSLQSLELDEISVLLNVQESSNFLKPSPNKVARKDQILCGKELQDTNTSNQPGETDELEDEILKAEYSSPRHRVSFETSEHTELHNALETVTLVKGPVDSEEEIVDRGVIPVDTQDFDHNPHHLLGDSLPDIHVVNEIPDEGCTSTELIAQLIDDHIKPNPVDIVQLENTTGKQEETFLIDEGLEKSISTVGILSITESILDCSNSGAVCTVVDLSDNSLTSCKNINPESSLEVQTSPSKNDSAFSECELSIEKSDPLHKNLEELVSKNSSLSNETVVIDSGELDTDKLFVKEAADLQSSVIIRSNSPPIVAKQLNIQEILDDPSYNPFTGLKCSVASVTGATTESEPCLKETNGLTEPIEVVTAEKPRGYSSLEEAGESDVSEFDPSDVNPSNNLELLVDREEKVFESVNFRTNSPPITVNKKNIEDILDDLLFNPFATETHACISESKSVITEARDSTIKSESSEVNLGLSGVESSSTFSDTPVLPAFSDTSFVKENISNDSGIKTAATSNTVFTNISSDLRLSFCDDKELKNQTDICHNDLAVNSSDSEFTVDEIEQLQLDATKVIQEIANLSQECIKLEENLIVETAGMTSVINNPEVEDANRNVRRDDSNCNVSSSVRGKPQTDVLPDGCKIETEAGPDIAPFSEEDFRPGEEALKEYETSDQYNLEECLRPDHPDPSKYRDSLYVKFDPLFSNRIQQTKPVSAVQPLKSVSESGAEKDASLLINSPDRTPDRVKDKGTGVLINITPSSSRPQKSMPPWAPGTQNSKQESEDFVRKINELKLEHQEDLLSKDKYYEEKIKKQDKDMDKLKKKLRDTEAELSKLKISERRMSEVVVEYEKTMSQLISEKDSSETVYKKGKEEAERERDQALEDLRSVEFAFNTFNSKYERAKAAVEDLKRNEETLKCTVQEYQTKLKRQENKYDLLKQHAEEKLSQANTEIETLKKNHEGEVARLTAMLKKTDMKASSLEKSLEQKIKENEQLSAICDDLINRV